MKQQSRSQALVWGSMLIIFGVLGLVNAMTDLSVWTWAAILAGAGLLMFGVFLLDRSEWWPLIPAYALWATAGLLALVELNFLYDSFIAIYVLTAIALPFVVVFLRDQTQWWALIPAYVMLVVATMILLGDIFHLPGAFEGTFILTAIALPFLYVYLRNRSNWWALIPAYVLLSIALMILLEDLGLLYAWLTPAYIMFVIAIPFFVVYFRNPTEWWPLIPGGILAAFGLSFLLAEAFQYVLPAVVILVGAWILLRAITRKESLPDTPSLPVEEGEDDQQLEG